MAAENVSILVTHDNATIFYGEDDFTSWAKGKYGQDAVLGNPKSYPCALPKSELRIVHSITPWYRGDFIYEFES